MHRLSDIALTALAPLIWGSTYIVTVTFLPGLDPLLVSFLRAMPAGLLLLLFTRQLPTGIWWLRIFLLGALNFSFFWWMLFTAAYRLPGGVAATVGAIQPLIIVFLARSLVGTPIKPLAIIAAIGGALGVGLLILKPSAALDLTGIGAGLLGALSMAFGTVLTRRWQPPVPLLTFTAWQLTAGGILLLPALFLNLPALSGFTAHNLIGVAYLSLIGAGFTYIVWFRGIARLNPNLVAQLGFLSPVTAVALGLLFKGETLSALQWLGIALIFGSIVLGQRGLRRGK
ncbi:DMT family transporter [Pleomorphomonas sp. PLEO]|uniref:DMT family transporter n=1 Tax=Pleomorphomonas sp. PLEO TaxID=3239306 RepID=UPI00351F0881